MSAGPGAAQCPLWYPLCKFAHSFCQAHYALAQALADQGWQVRGTTRTPSKLADQASQGWQILPFQSGQPVTDPPIAFADVDAIISTITAIGGSDPVLDAHGDDLANFSGWSGYVSATSVYPDMPHLTIED